MYCRFWACVWCILLIPFSVNAIAPDVPLKIAIFDLDKIIHESLVGKYIQKKSDQKRAELHQEIEQQETTLREEEKELIKKGTTSGEGTEMVAAFKAKVEDVQKAFASKREALEEAFNGARAEVIQAIMKLVAEISDEHKITLALPKSVVLLRVEGFEFTDELISRLNKRLPTVKIKVPKGE